MTNIRLVGFPALPKDKVNIVVEQHLTCTNKEFKF